ncbi:MAG TPA: glyoxalase superfamily protein [Candidatus Krumholzibacteria bacterium]|nr:glyoxalase superfamily protein [Candidatus Krumholzibacteria bacterium]
MNLVMPVLRVTDIDRSLAFYRDLLGFELAWRAANDGGGENCMLGRDTVVLLLSTGDHLGKVPAFTGSFYFNMDGVADLYATLKDKVEMVWPLEEMDYGTLEFGVRDPDGYLLAFAEERS